MSYLSFIWGRATKTALQPLLTLQNWSVRVLFGFQPYFPVLEMYKRSNILPFDQYVKVSSSIFFYKILHHHTNVRTTFTFINQTTSYNIRSGPNLAISPVFSTKYGLNSAKSKMLAEFNSLDKSVKDAPTLSSFQRSLKKNALSNLILLCFALPVLFIFLILYDH